MTTRFDDDEDPDFGPIDPTASDHDPDDPLLVLLGPAPAYLGAPLGRFEEIRRTATRRRRTRTAAGVGMVCAVAALIALPLNLTTAESPRSPTVPQAPPAATSPSAPPADGSPTAAPTPATPQPSVPGTTDPGTPAEEPTEEFNSPSQAPRETSDVTTDESPVPSPAATSDPTTAAITSPTIGTGDAATPGGTTAP
ncbi:hypothetical protein ACW4TU_19250 [Streptomyces sp. QTS52]